MGKEKNPFIKNGESVFGEQEKRSSPEDTARIQKAIEYIHSKVPELKSLRERVVETAKQGGAYQDSLKNLKEQIDAVRTEAENILGADLNQRWDDDPDSTAELVELASAFWKIPRVPEHWDLQPG